MDSVLGFVFMGFAAAAIIAVAAQNRNLALPLIIGFSLRAGLALIDATVYMLPGQDDSVSFDRAGWYWARNGPIGTFDYIGTGGRLYTWLVSFFYAIFERSRLMMQSFNVLFGTLIILNVARLTSALGKDIRLERRAAWLTALFPSLLYFSAVMLREIAVTYPLTLGVLFLVRWFKERKNGQMVGTVGFLLVSMSFHSGAFAVLLVLGVWLIGSWFHSVLVGGFRFFGRNTLALIGGALALAFVVQSGYGMDKFQHVSAGGVDALSTAQDGFAHGRAAYLQDLHPESRADVTWQAPIRLAYFLFAPFPWMIETGSDLVGLVDSGFFAFLFWHLFRERKVVVQRRETLLVLAVFGTMALVFAVGVSNYGTAHRHRNKMLPLLIAAACALPIRRAARARLGVRSTAPPRPLLARAVAGRPTTRPPPAARLPAAGDGAE